MAKKRGRCRMGHITADENGKVSAAHHYAERECMGLKHGAADCLLGVFYMRKRLNQLGFKVDVREMLMR